MRQFEPEKKSTIKRAFEKDESLVASKLGFDNEKIEVRKEKSQSSNNDDRNRHLNYHSQSWYRMGEKSGTVGLRKNNLGGKSGWWQPKPENHVGKKLIDKTRSPKGVLSDNFDIIGRGLEEYE